MDQGWVRADVAKQDIFTMGLACMRSVYGMDVLIITSWSW